MNRFIRYQRSSSFWLVMLTGIITVAIIMSGTHSPLFAACPQQKSFATPEEAVSALVTAVRTGEKEELLSILGPDGDELISSGDETADKVEREQFLNAYEKMNKLEKVSVSKMILRIGEDNWLLPMPIVKKNNAWAFDTNAAKEETLNRRIGRNELNVIEVLHAYVDAQREYASKDCKGGGVVEFAQQFVSTEGKHDGLYWDAKEGEEMSPLGPLVAQAAKEGYAEKSGGIDFWPFHGYYYRILKGQGKHATGRAYDYVVKDKMILGFAAVAYPAQYGNSGIMTFIVNQEGVIYEKNLGKNNTEKIAMGITKFDPDRTWKKVEETQKAEANK